MSAPGSIRHRLLRLQIGMLLLLGLAAAIISFALATHSFATLRTLELTQIANAIARHGIESTDPDEPDDNPGDFLSQVWETDGKLAYASHAPEAPRPSQRGDFDMDLGGKRWHAHASDYGGMLILVAREEGARSRLLRQLTLPTLGVVALLTILIAAASWRLIGRALEPLEHLREQLLARDPKALEALPLERQADELVPLVSTLNSLLVRVASLLEHQRQFVADAAHELRTPIAAVRLYGQLAERTLDADERANALAQLQQSGLRATRVVEQLLALARLEPEAQAAGDAVALDALVREVVAEHSPFAESRNIDLGLARAEALRCRGNADELRMMLGNLVDNAVRYTLDGGRIDLRVFAGHGTAHLDVIDNGPGIPAAERENVFERFHRLAGADQPGSGLGLAIVKRIAERHGGYVALDDAPGGGLWVSVRLPRETGPR
ncbi:ATP-binding protein [Niveibacterium sp. SC-1]|uniref:sensor histidine kinase n=1 Tax=Niveibacterium sp. SC-1 TaxID=3135646 RepID=UPI00311DDA2F